MSLLTRQTSTEQEAAGRFAEATRSSSFSLSLGVIEIRLIRDNEWRLFYRRSPSELAALQRLIDKGLAVAGVDHQPPRLSHAGQLMRELLILSKHIVVDTEDKLRLDSSDILEIINHGMQWYRDGNAYLTGSSIKRGADRSVDELRITTAVPDYDVKPTEELLRPVVKQTFVIKREHVVDIEKLSNG